LASIGSGAPPEDAMRRLAKSSGLPAGACNMAFHMVGTPAATVSRCRWIRSSISPGSKRGRSASEAPMSMVVPMMQAWP
jgi:hypothetical protein